MPKNLQLSSSLGKKGEFFESVFKYLPCPVLIVDEKARLITYSPKFSEHFPVLEDSIGNSIFRQSFIASNQVNILTQALAKERLSLPVGSRTIKLQTLDSGIEEFNIHTEKFQHQSKLFIAITFTKKRDIQSSYRNKNQKKNSADNLSVINDAINLCNKHIDSVNKKIRAYLDDSQNNIDGGQIRNDFDCHCTSLKLSLDKINLLNSIYTNTIQTEYRYHSINETIDEAISKVESFVSRLSFNIVRDIDKNSFAFFDKKSMVSLISSLIFIKLDKNNDKNITINSKNDDNSNEITIQCCKGDFPLSSQSDNFDLNELVNSEMGLNKSVWSLMGDGIISINNGKMLFSEDGKNETVLIRMPIAPMN